MEASVIYIWAGPLENFRSFKFSEKDLRKVERHICLARCLKKAIESLRGSEGPTVRPWKRSPTSTMWICAWLHCSCSRKLNSSKNSWVGAGGGLVGWFENEELVGVGSRGGCRAGEGSGALHVS